jgi:membrane protease YdiL (CAAX protease family)
VTSDLVVDNSPWQLPARQGAFVLAAAVGGFIGGQFLALVLVATVRVLSGTPESLRSLEQGTSLKWWVTASGLLGIWGGLLAAVGLSRRKYPLLPSRLGGFRRGDLRFALLGAGLQVAVILAYAPFHVRGLDGPVQKIFGQTSALEMVILCLMTALGAPLVEEIFFRGMLLPALLATRPAIWRPGRTYLPVAIVLNGILFGAAHGELLQLPAIALTGMVFAYLYVRTQRLIPCIIAHASFNSVSVAILIVHRIH